MIEIQDVLMKRRQALRKALTGDMSLLSDLSELHASGDVVDWAIDATQDEISSQLAEFESRELAQVQHLVLAHEHDDERIRIGKYGVCEDCEQPIPALRLKALPYATCCIECQRKAERQGPLEHRSLPLVSFADEFSDAELEVL